MSKVKKINRPQLKFDYHFNSYAFRIALISLFAIVCYWIMQIVIALPPQRDSGCFLYIGQNWLKGFIPYKDMWDHKGPLLYLLNAIGILMNGKTGVLYLQIVLTSVGFFYLYKTCYSLINQLAAICIALTGFFILYFLHQSGNQTEQWAIFFQAIALFLFFNEFESKTINKTSWLAIGFLMACALLLRPNQIALWLLIALFELLFLIKKITFKLLLLRVVFGLIGFVVPVLLFTFYFLFHHALNEMIDCLFVFNFAYTNKNHLSVVENLEAGLKTIPFLWVVFSGAFINLFVYVVKFKSVSSKEWTLLFFSCLWLVLEIILASLAGIGPLHYYVQWILPALLVFCSFIVSINLIIKNKQQVIYFQILISAIVLLYMFFEAKAKHEIQMAEVETYKNESMFRERVVDKITEETGDSDYVLQWGMVDGINFMAERKSPTRYFYQYALDTKGYTSEKRVSEFLIEIKAKKPKLIIDAAKMERFPNIDREGRDTFYKRKPERKGLLPVNIDEFYKYVEDNYIYDGNIGYMLMYKRKN